MTAWIGVRLLRYRSQRWSLVVLGATAFVSGLVLLSLCSVPGVISAQSRASAALELVDTGSPTGLAGQTTYWEWRDDRRIQIIRMGLTGAAVEPDIPGVNEVPKPGHVRLSPQLEVDLRNDSDLRAAFPQHIDGLIYSAALASSRDRVAYVGVSAESLRQAGFEATQRFGAPAPSLQGTSATAIVLGVGTIVIFLGVPLTALFLGAFGLLAQPRRTQVRLLVILGLRDRRARHVVCADGVLVGLASSVTSIGAFALGAHFITSVPLTPAVWTSGQSHLTVSGVVLSLLAPLIASAIAAGRIESGARPIRGRSRKSVISPFVGLAVGAAGIAAVLASSRVRADSSPVSAALVLASLLLAGIGMPMLIRALQLVTGQKLLRWSGRGAASVMSGARLSRGTWGGGRSATLLVSTFILSLAIAPLVAQVAPRDTQTALLNERAGRVVALVSPAPAAAVQAKIAAIPGVMSVAPPMATKGEDSAKLRYIFDCASARRLLFTSTCVPGRVITMDQLDPVVGASFPLLGDWEFVEGDSGPDAGIVNRQDTPLIVLVSDEDSYWRVSAAARGLDPQLDVEANLGGLIGGSDQAYLAMQRWLRVGLGLLVIASGILAALMAFTDIRERGQLHRTLKSLGASGGQARKSLIVEVCVRSATVVLGAALGGLATSFAARGWASAEPLPPGWIAGTFAVLMATLMVGFITSLAAASMPPADGRAAEDGYMRA